MPTREQFERELAEMETYIAAMKDDRMLTWCGRTNLPELVPAELRAAAIRAKMAYP